MFQTSVTVPSQSDLCLDTRLDKMDTGEGILDSPREYTTDGEVSVLDLTEMEGVSLDDLADMEGVPLSDPEDEEADGEGIYYDEVWEGRQ